MEINWLSWFAIFVIVWGADMYRDGKSKLPMTDYRRWIQMLILAGGVLLLMESV